MISTASTGALQLDDVSIRVFDVREGLPVRVRTALHKASSRIDDGGNRGRWIPTTSIDQYGATLAAWYGLDPSLLTAVFPNLSKFATQNHPLPSRVTLTGESAPVHRRHLRHRRIDREIRRQPPIARIVDRHDVDAGRADLLERPARQAIAHVDDERVGLVPGEQLPKRRSVAVAAARGHGVTSYPRAFTAAAPELPGLRIANVTVQ